MTPSDENPLGYINTSAMKLENSPLKFYASQGPLENTTIDFWAMIYKCKIPTIIMLTNYCELGVQKCHEYLPKTKLKILDGVYIVFDEVKKNVDTMTITKLHFEFKNTRRNITHIVFKKWEDKEVPSNEDFNIIINEVRSLVQKSSIKKICVHCSAGAGRTGVLICILYVLMVQIPNEFINIDGTIADMRLCRSQMVQTSQQYRFIHLFIIQRLDELID
ncbi:MAG: Tyrosine-protein phosphatase non-receptor type 22 [Marteilia pararefringens]